jgi:transcriptional regulator with XRE-family HTH domain
MDPVNFHKVLRELRLEENLTQEDISNLLHIDRSNIANYERGKRLPSIESLIKIAEFFDVSLDYLILGKRSGGQRGEETEVVVPQEAMRELMADNTALMEEQLRLADIVAQKEEEIKVLKNYQNSLKEYNNFLEAKIKLLESQVLKDDSESL